MITVQSSLSAIKKLFGLMALFMLVISQQANAGFIGTCDGLEKSPTMISGGGELTLCYNPLTNDGAFYGVSPILNTDILLYNENYSFNFENLFNFGSNVDGVDSSSNYAIINPIADFTGDFFIPFKLDSNYQFNGFLQDQNKVHGLANLLFTEINTFDVDPKNTGYYYDIGLKQQTSTNSVPEPSTLAILALGLLGFSRYRIIKS